MGGAAAGRPIAHSQKLEGERVVQFLLSPVLTHTQTHTPTDTHTGAVIGFALDRWAGRTKRRDEELMRVDEGTRGGVDLQDAVL